MTHIETLLKKKRLTGDEVGQLVIADLVTLYKSALKGGEKGLLTSSEKSKLVGLLETKEDIRAYNEYKYLHDFVVTVPMRYLVAKNTAETAFWKLFSLLDPAMQAETFNAANPYLPRIVTQKQYDSLPEKARQGAYAILQESEAARPVIDENGGYKQPSHDLYEFFRAEHLVEEHTAFIAQCIQNVKRHYREMFAYHVFLEIAGEFSHVEDLEVLLSPIDENIINAINANFQVWNHIKQADNRDEAQRQALIKALKAMFKPIDMEALKPNKKAIAAAKANMSFQIFQGYAAEFINHYLITEDEDE